MAKQRTKGSCGFCGKVLTRSGLTRHLDTCAKRKALFEKEGAEGKGEKQVLFHLVAQDAWAGEYWLHLEMNASATLQALDKYLRAIWLECCGHMSQFTIGDPWTGKKLGKTQTLEKAFSGTDSIQHVYDFGTSSETKITLVAWREGQPLGPKPIFLMARNAPLQDLCQSCDTIATHLCIECLEINDYGLLCTEHAQEHSHDDYGEPVPIYNSPRMGMCGYAGPALPPY